MLRLLSIEFEKIRGNKSFWIFGLLFIICFPLLMIGIPTTLETEIAPGQSINFFQPTSWKQCWYITSYAGGWFVILMLSFIIIYNITNEYTYRTVRQNVIDGFSKSDFLKSKFITLFSIASFVTILIFITGLILGLYFQGKVGDSATSLQDLMTNMKPNTKSTPIDFGHITDGIGFVPIFFFQTVAYFSWAFLLSVFLKKAGIANLLFNLSIIAEYIFSLTYYNYNGESLYYYFPFRAISKLVPNPTPENFFSGLNFNYNFSDLFIVIIYTGLCIYGSIRIFKKQDL